MAQMSGGDKAFFTNVDASPNEVFYVQFNPKEIQLDEQAVWKDSGEHERYRPLLTYEKGEPSKLSMELIFDTTDSGENCYEAWVRKLRDFLSTTFSGQDADGKDITRPPHVIFTWGAFNFDCVVESLGCTFLMFKPDGTPLRSRVTIGLKEREREDAQSVATDQVTLSAMGSMFSGAADQVAVYVVQEGDTLTNIAAAMGVDMHDIAAANGIQDPMNLPVGEQLVIPGDSDLAEILAGQALADAGGAYADEVYGDPFNDALDGWGDAAEGLPDPFEDAEDDLGVILAAAGPPPDQIPQMPMSTAELMAMGGGAQNAVDDVVNQANDAGFPVP